MFDKNLLEQFKTNRHERYGTICLIILTVALVVTFRFVNNKDVKKSKTNPELVKLLDEYYANKPQEENNPEIKKSKKSKRTWPKKQQPKKIEKIESTLFTFDPNTIDYQGLIKLGFSSRQANTLIKFRSSGFRFKSLRDIHKVHGLDSAFIARIESYIEFPTQITKEDSIKYNKKDTLQAISEKVEIPFRKIEINNATTTELMALKGIGKIYSGIIINYRDDLGGYIDLAQIKEAFDFPDTTLRLLEKSLTVNSSELKKININTVTFKELLSHPYLSYEENKILYPFITTRRPLDNLDFLNDILAVDTTTINRLKPYLTTK